MKKSTWLVMIILAISCVFVAQAVAGDHEYVGATKCKTCHKGEKKGMVFEKWTESKHAGAFTTLAGEKAKEIATAKGIEDPQKADACLKCHVTGHGAKAELLGKKYDAAEGVTCESCHGAGGDYWKMKTMKALAAGEMKGEEVGYVVPDEKTCVKCHNEESPTFKGFKFDEMWAKIEHSVKAEE